MSRYLFCLLIACLAWVTPVAAQDEAWPQTEVVVHGRAPEGPALWRVSRGESQVIILGVLPVFPRALPWKTRRVENALHGANLMITPPTSQTGLGALWTIMRNKNLPGHGRLKEVLPPALNLRYEATARRAGVDIADFAHDRPVWAGARLRRLVLQTRGLDEDEPLRTITRIANAQGVPSRPAVKMAMKDVFRDVNAMDEAASEACLGYALDDIDFDLDRAAAAARAWAVGDLAAVRANYHGSALMKCLSGSDRAAALSELSASGSLAAIKAALQRPGKSVAVLPMALLLRRNGVLDRLRAAGMDVSTPGD